MDAALFERLLNEEEGATLDFKRDQYPFAGGGDEEKSEVLKDILAFANAWRRADAYILIGVEEVRGARSNVVGVTEHLDDHSLQQFVTHLTNRPPHFSYEAFTFDGKQVGIIKIDQQPRPFYLKADYGRLKKKIVYLRRGSSTCEADLDEIARMGAPVVQEEADLHLEFAELDREASLGNALQLEATYCELPPKDAIPDLDRDRKERFANEMEVTVVVPSNKAYYREKADFVFAAEFFRRIRLLVTNAGTATAHNVRVELAVAREARMGIVPESEMPQRPEKSGDGALMKGVRPVWRDFLDRHDGRVQIESHADKFKIVVECGTLQPKRPMVSDVFFAGRAESGPMKLTGLIYADNLSSPKPVELLIDFTVARKQVSVRELIAGDS